MELKDIRAIIDLMKKNDLAVFKLEKEGFKLELEAHRPPPSFVSVLPGHQAIPAATVPGYAAPGHSAPPGVAVEVKEAHKEIVSPMVGTFYRAPSPDSAPYVKEGHEIAEETVVCIIEAMKVMNEIKAEVKGVVTQILVENAKPVEFGQPMFKIRPN